MAKRQVPLYDFAALGQAIKAARTARKESSKDVSDTMNISRTPGSYQPFLQIPPHDGHP